MATQDKLTGSCVCSFSFSFPLSEIKSLKSQEDNRNSTKLQQVALSIVLYSLLKMSEQIMQIPDKYESNQKQW